MSITAGAVDVGFLGVTWFGVWSGRTLWSRHIELKHEREMGRLSLDRMKESAQLEMAVERNLAEIAQRDAIIATERMRVEGTPPSLKAGEP